MALVFRLGRFQRGATDLPLALSSGRDVYLFITAGAAYTQVRTLALPTVPAARGRRWRAGL